MRKETLLVEAIRNGTVIDHIPSDKLFAIVSLLGLKHVHTPITIGNNLESGRLGRKGIIKISDHYFTEGQVSRIAILAPEICINTIQDYEVVEKKQLALPESVVGLVRCPNHRCITNAEPMPTRFAVGRDHSQAITLECAYCGRSIHSSEAELI